MGSTKSTSRLVNARRRGKALEQVIIQLKAERDSLSLQLGWQAQAHRRTLDKLRARLKRRSLWYRLRRWLSRREN